MEAHPHPLPDRYSFGIGIDHLGRHAHAGRAVDVDDGEREGDGHAGRPGLVVDGVAVDRPGPGNRPVFNGLAPAFRTDDLRRMDRVIASGRSEEHTSELQSLMRTSYAVFCL